MLMDENIVVSTKFQVEIQRDTVLQMMECYEDSPIYKEVVEEYEEISPLVLEHIKPQGVIAFDFVPEEYGVPEVLESGSKAIYALMTIGIETTELREAYFAENDYLKSMLVDRIEDACIFAMEKDFLAFIKKECLKRKIGVSNRLEAPVDIPMIFQKIAVEKTRAKETIGLDITSGYMLNPLKSNCIVFPITEEKNIFCLEHDCKKCSNIHCQVRDIPEVLLTLIWKNTKQKVEIRCQHKETILEALRRNEIYMPVPCGGNGTCGKCKIRLISGKLSITDADKNCFTDVELEEGYRLSCKAYPTQDCSIELSQNQEEDFEILGVSNTNTSKNRMGMNQKYSIAIDIGTTTIASSLFHMKTKDVIDTHTCINHQRMYGIDVISRIQASNDGKGKGLRVLIQKDLLKSINMLLEPYHIKVEQVEQVVISANTTMGHLLLGFSCETLGIVPFTPVDIGLIEKSFQEIFEVDGFSNAKVTILPGITTYVGGDIVSGIYACEMEEKEGYHMLVDLGTNGEMTLGNKDGFLVASTAAGPACEGGNITWGMGGIPGAICSLEIQGSEALFQTLGNQAPTGLCGTGVLETVAELLKSQWINETGRLKEEYFEDGFPLAVTESGEKIVFTQKDIREIQLAKAAIRAGVETLIETAGINYNQVEKIYVAGGFGFNLDIEKAVAIGLFPNECVEKIEIVGNTSLLGAIKYLKQDSDKKSLEQIVNRAKEVPLATDKKFQELYMEHMFFE